MISDYTNNPDVSSMFDGSTIIQNSQICSYETLLIAGTVLILIVLFVELFDWDYWFSPATLDEIKKKTKTENFAYGYEDDDGPAVWKQLFDDALGTLQSPINIVSSDAVVCPCKIPLTWSMAYGCPPEVIRLTNDGHGVVLHAKYAGDRPSISGGPLNDEQFEFHNIRFRWGPCDEEGSEHTIDFRRFALEMQAIHVKPNSSDRKRKTKNSKCMVAIISYLFQITPLDNPYLDPIVSNLKNIVNPKSRSSCPTLPLCWLMPSFGSDYYSYVGSLTYPPCTEGIIWMIQPEPLAISSRQVRKFRKLLTFNGNLITNTRPIQCTNDRDIYYLFYSNCDCDEIV